MKQKLSDFDYVLITTETELEQICQQARQQPVVALDTEFIRIRSYYPKLGLIQLYDGQQVSLIDPLQISDFTPFIELLADSKVLKLLHAGSEDLEIFQHQFQQMPMPMVDTQIMADFLGFPLSVGFAKLVEHFFEVHIDKAISRTDWLARPLSLKQCYYAGSDVFYLLPIYQKLQQQLVETQWYQAVIDESEALIYKRQRQIDPDLAYLEIGNAWRLNRQELTVLQKLAKWRLTEAIKRDLAPNFVLKSESLYRLAQTQPKHTSQLFELELHPNEIRHHGKKLLSLIAQAQRIDPTQYPPLVANIALNPNYKKAIRLLQNNIKKLTPTGLTPQLIGSKRLLHQLLTWYWQKNNTEKVPKLLQNWRKPFGEQLLILLQQGGI
ncbi:ribonuclease D [Mergibacter septicus]|uniref:ribonuclease D n=1 Tax=Mergibacter septicus TaxID=221402 RepID=UPI0011794378|nr:ribonuclease D [Mergibacter septicus]AWX13518.1 ribonuclease D [Mergibacter septicus]